jgi:hypothetical protein
MAYCPHASTAGVAAGGSVARQLEPNQRTYFEDAYGDLMPDDVSARLHLPNRATWPAQRPVPPKPEGKLVASLLGAGRALASDVAPATVVKGATAPTNTGRSTFRVIGTAALAGTLLGFALALVMLFVAAATGLLRHRWAPGRLHSTAVGPSRSD